MTVRELLDIPVLNPPTDAQKTAAAQTVIRQALDADDAQQLLAMPDLDSRETSR